MPRTRLFKVQGMGHGRLKPERRSSRFEIGSARQIQFSKNWHARARSGRSRRRSGVHGFLSLQGFVCFCFPSLSGVEMDIMQRVMLHECMPALCETFGDEPHDGVSKLPESPELCFATQNCRRVGGSLQHSNSPRAFPPVSLMGVLCRAQSLPAT